MWHHRPRNGSPPGIWREVVRVALLDILLSFKRRMCMKKIVVLVALLVILPILACEFSFGAGGGEPHLGEGVACHDVTSDYQPIGPTTAFSPMDDLYVSVPYFDLEEGQEITLRWFYGEEVIDELAITIDASTAGREGHAASWFKDAGPWPVGDYHVDVYLDGELDHTINFHVE
jgi:hypothetical protein